MRNLVDVIKQLKDISSKENFNLELNDIEDSYYYTAPEVKGRLWNRVHEAIIYEYEDEINGRKEPSDECILILSCFTTMSVEEVKESLK